MYSISMDIVDLDKFNNNVPLGYPIKDVAKVLNNKTIEIFSNKLDKLEDKLDSISFKIRTCKDIE